MNRTWAVVWAQWRTYRNYTNRKSVALGVILGVLWYGIWTAAAIGAAILMSQPDVASFVVPISGALLLMSMYWQFIPMMMAASGLALDLPRLKPYPIPIRELFTVEVLLRATAAIEMIVILIGVFIGVAVNPALPLWCAAVVIPFAAFHMLLSLGFRDIVARVLSHRRMREVAALLFVALITLPRVLFGPRSGAGMWLARQFRDSKPEQGVASMPWTAAARLLTNQDVGVSAIVLLGWCAAAGAFALWQFRRTLRFDVEEARSTGSAPARSTGFAERFYRAPSNLFRDPLGAMIEKELRYLARAPRFRMLFLMGFTLGVVIPRAMYQSGGVANWAPGYLTAAMAYSLLILGEACIWNIFGFDRSAAQMYFVSPVRISRVFAAKNVSASFWLLLQLVLMWGLGRLLQTPVGLLDVAEAATFALVTVLLLWSVGNYVSARNARAADPDSSMRARTSGGTQALLLFVYPLTFAPSALAYFARWAFESQLAFYGVMAVLAALAACVYWVALESAARYAEENREALVTALSAGQGPIAN